MVERTNSPRLAKFISNLIDRVSVREFNRFHYNGVISTHLLHFGEVIKLKNNKGHYY